MTQVLNYFWSVEQSTRAHSNSNEKVETSVGFQGIKQRSLKYNIWAGFSVKDDSTACSTSRFISLTFTFDLYIHTSPIPPFCVTLVRLMSSKLVLSWALQASLYMSIYTSTESQWNTRTEASINAYMTTRLRILRRSGCAEYRVCNRFKQNEKNHWLPQLLFW